MTSLPPLYPLSPGNQDVHIIFLLKEITDVDMNDLGENKESLFKPDHLSALKGSFYLKPS